MKSRLFVSINKQSKIKGNYSGNKIKEIENFCYSHFTK